MKVLEEDFHRIGVRRRLNLKMGVDFAVFGERVNFAAAAAEVEMV